MDLKKEVNNMDRSADTQLNDIKKIVLNMGGSVERAVEIAIDGLRGRRPEVFTEVHKIEESINEAHVHLDNSCLKFLAQQGPVARDLRYIFSLIKINSDLERMGDQAVNIAHTGKDFLQRPEVSIPIEIAEMTQIVRQMVRESLDSFVREDSALAQKILLMDDEVDRRKDEVFRKMTTFVRQSPDSVESALDLILVARNLERLGDHATNIAEDVIFVSTGEDVRHGGKFS